MLWWMELNLVSPKGRAMSNSVFGDVYELDVALGRFSANGWFYVPVLLMIWHEALTLEFSGLWVAIGLSFQI